MVPFLVYMMKEFHKELQCNKAAPANNHKSVDILWIESEMVPS